MITHTIFFPVQLNMIISAEALNYIDCKVMIYFRFGPQRYIAFQAAAAL